jgi:hypothetical protein
VPASHRHAHGLPDSQAVTVDVLVPFQPQQLLYTQTITLRNRPTCFALLDSNMTTAFMTVQNLRGSVVSPYAKAAVDASEHQQQEYKDEECEREHCAHGLAVVPVHGVVALFDIFGWRVACRLGRLETGWFEFPVAGTRFGLEEVAVGVAEGVALCVGIVAYALHALGQAMLVLELISSVLRSMSFGTGLTSSMSVKRPIFNC